SFFPQRRLHQKRKQRFGNAGEPFSPFALTLSVSASEKNLPEKKTLGVITYGYFPWCLASAPELPSRCLRLRSQQVAQRHLREMPVEIVTVERSRRQHCAAPDVHDQRGVDSNQAHLHRCLRITVRDLRFCQQQQVGEPVDELPVVPLDPPVDPVVGSG